MIDNAYWAGLFDGEGCVHISKDLRHLEISVTQKKTAILSLLKQTFGGNVSGYKWRAVSTKNAIRFLESIQPHVIIKANGVKIALEFCYGKRVHPAKQNRLSEDELSNRNRLRGLLRHNVA